jgi:hypothetical protein
MVFNNKDKQTILEYWRGYILKAADNVAETRE